jgi:hypothetical protein
MVLRYVKELHVRFIIAVRNDIAVVNAKKYCLCDIRV